MISLQKLKLDGGAGNNFISQDYVDFLDYNFVLFFKEGTTGGILYLIIIK